MKPSHFEANGQGLLIESTMHGGEQPIDFDNPHMQRDVNEFAAHVAEHAPADPYLAQRERELHGTGIVPEPMEPGQVSEVTVPVPSRVAETPTRGNSNSPFEGVTSADAKAGMSQTEVKETHEADKRGAAAARVALNAVKEK